MPVEEGTGKSAGFIVVNLSPDVCRSPTTPIPYNIIAFLSDGFKTSEAQGKLVNFQGFPAFNMKSRVTRSFGDTPGVGLGLGSASVQGWCRPITPVVTVKCNGTELCRHEHTKFQMNCLGPEGPGNTIGKVIYLGMMLPGSVPAEGGVPPAANPPLNPDTPKEPSFLDKIKDSLKIESVKDAVDLAQRAYELSQVDWSNPSAALGALAGMAGRAGLGDVAKAINLGKKAIETDWSKPSEALKAAAGMAGDAWALAKSSGLVGDDEKSKKESKTPDAKAPADGKPNSSEKPSSNSITVSNFTVSNFTVSNFTVSNFTVSNFTVSNFTVINFTVSNFTVINFTTANYPTLRFSTPSFSVRIANSTSGVKWAEFAFPTTNE